MGIYVIAVKNTALCSSVRMERGEEPLSVFQLEVKSVKQKNFMPTALTLSHFSPLTIIKLVTSNRLTSNKF